MIDALKVGSRGVYAAIFLRTPEVAAREPLISPAAHPDPAAEFVLGAAAQICEHRISAGGRNKIAAVHDRRAGSEGRARVCARERVHEMTSARIVWQAVGCFVLAAMLLPMAAHTADGRARKARHGARGAATDSAQRPQAAPAAGTTQNKGTAGPAASETNGSGASAATAASGAAGAPAAAATGAAAAVTSAAPQNTWTEDQIATAKARCTAVLARIKAVAIPHAPIKQGACGAAAPIELVSLGDNPQVAFSPPAIITCDLAENIAKWLEEDLQPLARQHFGSQIIRIDTMSSYSCRNAYGRKTTRLSEHALANALDIGDFVTASAKTAAVLAGWGTPQREVMAQAAAEKARAEKEAAEKLAAEKAATAESAAAGDTPGKGLSETHGTAAPSAPGTRLARPSIVEGVPDVKITLPRPSKGGRNAIALSIGAPDRLGGPGHGHKKRRRGGGTTAISQMDPADPAVTAFLHEAHEAACKIFGTTLGPEANADHRNHFHVDMAPRKYKKICD